jgi:hypothetical protein
MTKIKNPCVFVLFLALNLAKPLRNYINKLNQYLSYEKYFPFVLNALQLVDSGTKQLKSGCFF